MCWNRRKEEEPVGMAWSQDALCNYVVLLVENTYHVTMVLLFFLVFELDIPYADDVFLRKYILGDRARMMKAYGTSVGSRLSCPRLSVSEASAPGARQLEMP